MYLYLLTESEFVLPDTGLCRCFGLRVVRVQKGRVEELLLLPDISADRSFVMHLAQLFTRLQPAPVHLRDILQDMLSKRSLAAQRGTGAATAPYFPRPAPPFRQLVAARTLRCRRFFHAARANLFVTAGQKGSIIK